jgi:hypothetical protein
MKKSLAADSSFILLYALSIYGNVVKSFLIIGFQENEAIVLLLKVSMILLDTYSTQSDLRFGVSIFASNIDRAYKL